MTRTTDNLDDERRRRGLQLMCCQDETAQVVNGVWHCNCPTPGHSGKRVVWFRGQAHFEVTR